MKLKLSDSLIEYGANNIKTISINSGYAGIADIQSLHISYAVCSYGFDTYVILGVPDIFITY